MSDDSRVKDKLLEMLNLQDNLNAATSGVEWRSGVTSLGKKISWHRCIYMETAELIDSFPWKHWKDVKSTPDANNIKTELVDIWHFVLSAALEKMKLGEALTLMFSCWFDVSPKSLHCSMDEQLKVFEGLMIAALSNQECENYLVNIINAFFDACRSVNFSFESLYKLYIAKNYLNKFRQNNGYKEGTYQKLWNGVEDNVIMHVILDDMQVFDASAFYNALQKEYKKLLDK